MSTLLINLLFITFFNSNKKVLSIVPINKNIENLSYENFNVKKYGLSKIVFDEALKGYQKLKSQNILKNKRYLTICDMSLSSKRKRLYIIDLETKTVKYNLRVSHGKESGEEYATKFSNTHESHQTSLGFYITGGEYQGENGQSLKLYGKEDGFNSNAFDRAVVIHGSEYVTDEYFKANNKIGRSWGCPAIPTKNISEVVKSIKNGSCLFVYHSDKTYHKKSKMLK